MYIESTDLDQVVAQVRTAIANANIPDPLAILLVGEKTKIEIPALIAALNEQKIAFVGGIFPGVIIGSQRHESGIVVTVQSALVKPFIIKELNQTRFSVETATQITQTVNKCTVQPTALIFVDGLTTNIELLLKRLFYRFQNRIAYVGGGAGSLSLKQQPCIFDPDGFYQDAAVLILINAQSQIGVRHGWRDLRGPIVATHTQRNVVLTLNNEPAFKRYSQIVKAETGQILSKENFFDIAKGFPLGLFSKGTDRIVRDPIAVTDDGGLICVGEVPQRSLVYILQSDNEHLISHARLATREALGSQKHIDNCFVVDCISRVLYLQERFNQELGVILSSLPPDSAEPIGILSLGEIGSYASGTVEFFNKTIVVCAMQNISAKSEKNAEAEVAVTNTTSVAV